MWALTERPCMKGYSAFGMESQRLFFFSLLKFVTSNQQSAVAELVSWECNRNSGKLGMTTANNREQSIFKTGWWLAILYIFIKDEAT